MSSNQTFVEDDSVAPAGAGDLWTDEYAPPPPPIPGLTLATAAGGGFGPAVGFGFGATFPPGAIALVAVVGVSLAAYGIYSTWTNGPGGFGTVDTEDTEEWLDDGTDYEQFGGKKLWNPYGEDETTEIGVIPAGPDLEEQTTRPVVDVTIEDPEEAEQGNARALSTDEIEGIEQTVAGALDVFGLQDGQKLGTRLGGAGSSGSGNAWVLVSGPDGQTWEDGKGEGEWGEDDPQAPTIFLPGGHSNGPIAIPVPPTPPKLVAVRVRLPVRT